MRKGYARLVGDERDLAMQCAALTEAGCAEVIIERDGGPAATARLTAQLGRLSPGDQLLVHRLDALAPDLATLSDALASALMAGASIRVLSPTPLRLCPSPVDEADTPSPAGFSGADALAVARALDHPYRLMIYRALYASGDAGLPRRRMPVPAPMAGAALSAHLRSLDEAKLIEPRRSEDETYYVARPAALRNFLAWLGKVRDSAACPD